MVSFAKLLGLSRKAELNAVWCGVKEVERIGHEGDNDNAKVLPYLTWIDLLMVRQAGCIRRGRTSIIRG